MFVNIKKQGDIVGRFLDGLGVKSGNLLHQINIACIEKLCVIILLYEFRSFTRWSKSRST